MSKTRKKETCTEARLVLALPDLEQSKTAVLNSLSSKSGQRTYDRAITDFVDWCSAFCFPMSLTWPQRRSRPRACWRWSPAGCLFRRSVDFFSPFVRIQAWSVWETLNLF
jgi:hypothetical protein